MRAMCSRSQRGEGDRGAHARRLVGLAFLIDAGCLVQTQIGGREDGAGGQNDRTLDGIAELAKIARPGVREHRLLRLTFEKVSASRPCLRPNMER